MMTIQRFRAPVIARVHGSPLRRGQLVAMCVLAVASSDAKFAVSGITVGLFCATPGVALSRNVGRKAAFEMLVTGDFIDAATARERGLVNRVVAPDQLDTEIEKLVTSILSKPSSALTVGKDLFYRHSRAESKRISICWTNDGLQHDRCFGARGCSSIHGETRTELVSCR